LSDKFRMIKLRIVLGLLAILLAIGLTGCGTASEDELEPGKVNVVTSFYPLYYFSQQIGGERAHVVNLIAAGVEPHDWTPKSKDLKAVSNAQIFLYNGAGLEGWVDQFLQGLGSDRQVLTVEASKGIELIKGNPEAEGESAAGSQLDVDPHTWVSPRSAFVMATNIRDAFIEVDPDHKAEYESNYKDLSDRLTQLDAKFRDGLTGLARRDIVVSHQAFGYLGRDYGLHQIAVMGLSPDAEPRAQDLLRISRFVKQNHVPYIFFEELVSPELAETLASEAGVATLELNPVEGLTPEQEQAGDTYFSLMERNLSNLQKALR
jgi:zinc transport system substrate-binding protein